MTTHRPNVIHDCKIDCTNPSEVMRILITKSDQLYLFWQNYNNLYEAYKALLIEVETLRSTRVEKTQSRQDGVPNFEYYIKTLEQNHQRQIKRLKDDKEEYSRLFQMKDQEIKKLISDNNNLRTRVETAPPPPRIEHPDPKLVKQQIKRLLMDLEQRYKQNLKQQLETAKWEVRQEMMKIITHTAQACVTEIVEETVETTYT